MTSTGYEDKELNAIRAMSAEGKTDQEIANELHRTLGISRTVLAISRKRAREGITKPMIYHYTKPIEWTDYKLFIVHDTYQTKSDEEIAEILGCNAPQVQRLRVKQGWLRRESNHPDPELIPPKPLDWHPEYLRVEIAGSHIESINQMKARKGTYADSHISTSLGRPTWPPMAWGKDICWEQSEVACSGSQRLGRETISVKQVRKES